MKDPTGCWLWQGDKLPRGYGQFRFDNRHVLAHRFAYEMAKGAIPPGLVIDHLCRVTSCVNPDHLEAVTNAENLRRGVGPSLTSARRRAQTHCKRGHLFDEANTYWKPNGARRCRACSRVSNLAAYYAARARKDASG